MESLGAGELPMVSAEIRAASLRQLVLPMEDAAFRCVSGGDLRALRTFVWQTCSHIEQVFI